MTTLLNNTMTINNAGIEVFSKAQHTLLTGKVFEDFGGFKFDYEHENEDTDILIDADLLPKVSASTLREELEIYATQQLEHREVLRGAERLCSFDLSSVDLNTAKIQLSKAAMPGCWTNYSFETKKISYKPPQDNEPLVLDFETFVKQDNYPLIFTAISDKGLYIWLHQSWDLEGEFTPSYLSLGSSRRLVVAHNIAFDFARLKERFTLGENPLSALCTMALGKALNGLDKTNSMFLISKNPLHRELKDRAVRLGCAGSLVANYEFSTGKKLAEGSKEIRNVFVDCNTVKEMAAKAGGGENLFSYAINDVILTLELFQIQYKQFRVWCSSNVVLNGLVQVADSVSPIVDHYDSWLDNCNNLSDKADLDAQDIILELAEELHEAWKLGAVDESLYPGLDWRLNKPKNYRKKVLPEGWKIQAKWYVAFLEGNLSEGKIAQLLRLRWNDHILYNEKRKWWYTDKRTGQPVGVPHYSGEKGAIMSSITAGGAIKFVENGSITSGVLSDEDLLKLYRLFDATSIFTGFEGRLRSQFIAVNGSPSNKHHSKGN